MTKHLITTGLATLMILPATIGGTVAEADAAPRARSRAAGSRAKRRAPTPPPRRRATPPRRGGRAVVPPPRVRNRVRTAPPRARVRPARRLRLRGRRVYRPGLYVAPTYWAATAVSPYAAPPVAAPQVQVAPPAPSVIAGRLGVGLYAGMGHLETDTPSDSYGLTARARLSRSLWVEGELGKSIAADGFESRRYGAGLVYDLSPASKLAPQVMAGVGMWDESEYAEVGVGLAYRLSPKLELTADVRAGARTHNDATRLMPVSGLLPEDADYREFTRARIGAMLYF